MLVWSSVRCWWWVALVPMVNKAQQESQASKGLQVRRGLRVPMVNKDLRVRRGLRDPRAIPVTLVLRGPRARRGLQVRRGLRVPMVNKDLRVRRGLRVRADRLMVRHVRLLGALSARWCRVSTPTVCWPLTA